ncbi:hypothetical protein PI125_g8917 [Phytophthora idaei]|nr:hypothetical protein PI125_g8917 [Phytophthora idaei]
MRAKLTVTRKQCWCQPHPSTNVPRIPYRNRRGNAGRRRTSTGAKSDNLKKKTKTSSTTAEPQKTRDDTSVQTAATPDGIDDDVAHAEGPTLQLTDGETPTSNVGGRSLQRNESGTCI